jgi:hypothetical protein
MKKQKLSIKNNWDKNLTLSPENKQMIKGGLSAQRCIDKSVRGYCEISDKSIACD